MGGETVAVVNGSTAVFDQYKTFGKHMQAKAVKLIFSIAH